MSLALLGYLDKEGNTEPSFLILSALYIIITQTYNEIPALFVLLQSHLSTELHGLSF